MDGGGGVKIVIAIGRLVLDGLALMPHEADRVKDAMAGELSRLFAADPLPARLLAGGAMPSLAAPPITTAAAASAQALGTEAARAVYASLETTR
jgi:hypothetical protein